MRPRKPLAIKNEPSKFTVENLNAIAKDLTSIQHWGREEAKSTT